jgi:hypothetical protein
MNPTIKSVLKGCLAATASELLLWPFSPFILSALTESWLLWFPPVLFALPMVVGGYVAATGATRPLIGSVLTGLMLATVAVIAAVALDAIDASLLFDLLLVLSGGVLAGVGGVLAVQTRRMRKGE